MARKTRSGTRNQPDGGVPDRETILRFIADHPSRSSKRDIAKAFAVRGQDRVELKNLLRDLEDEGLLARRRKQLVRPGSLPPVTVLDVTTRDDDGSLIGRPAEWSGDGTVAPAVLIRDSRQSKGKSKAPSAGVGDRVLARIFPSDTDTGPAYSARVMKVLDKQRGAVLGVFRATPGGGGRLDPVERRGKEIIIDDDDIGDAKDGDLVEVEAASGARYGLPRGRVASVIGSVASEKAISMIAIHAHGIPHTFPKAVLDEAAKAKPVSLGKREDWRSLPLITIDPHDAKDHDDAVYAEPDDNPENKGGVVVFVAIADVSHYVHAGSALDREALKRGNSVYFPDRVVPMLPERISNDLCSLKEGVDRPALAVRMVYSAQGRKIGHTFHRIMMKSLARLSYAQAQAAIDGAPDDKTEALLDGVLRPLWNAYGVLGRGRERRQPLELDIPEKKLRLKDDGTVDKVVIPDRLDAHRLIEEFMIQGQCCQRLKPWRPNGKPLIYRIHDRAIPCEAGSTAGFSQDTGHFPGKGRPIAGQQFQRRFVKGQGQTVRNHGQRKWCFVRRGQAVYSPDNIGHFGLNLMKYAHFTSPIRRYADLIVHRALVGSLNLGDGGITPEEEDGLEEIAAEISTFERRAMAAERETVDRLIRPSPGETNRRRFRWPDIRRNQGRPFCLPATIWRRWLCTGFNAGAGLLYL